MANPLHVEIVKNGSSEIQRFRRKAPDGTILDLSAFTFGMSGISRIDLSNKYLENADLINANLQGADLRGAILRGADLRCCNLSGALLAGADLTEARLDGTIFAAETYRASPKAGIYVSGAKPDQFDNTIFKRSELGRTYFDNLDLSLAKNLENTVHSQPSYLSISTLVRSKGKIPNTFLRGCGLSDWEIEASKLYDSTLNSLDISEIHNRIFGLRTINPIQFYSCFISYSHDDKEFAKNLFNRLQEQGIRCWLDEHQILPGDNIRDQIDKGINIWDKILICCSRSSLNSYWVNTELDKAFNKEERLWKDSNKKEMAIIPLNLDNYLFEWKNSRATILTDRHAEDLVDWEKKPDKLEKAIKRIEQVLRTDDQGREKPPEPLLY